VGEEGKGEDNLRGKGPVRREGLKVNTSIQEAKRGGGLFPERKGSGRMPKRSELAKKRGESHQSKIGKLQ